MALVLVIDDQVHFRELIRKILQDAGHEVIEAQSGKAGVRAFVEHRPDLVITDMFMPEQDGIETLNHIRSAAPDARIIAMSGGGSRGFTKILEVAEHMGADRTLPKPFTQADLLGAVNQTLQLAPGRS